MSEEKPQFGLRAIFFATAVVSVLLHFVRTGGAGYVPFVLYVVGSFARVWFGTYESGRYVLVEFACGLVGIVLLVLALNSLRPVT